MEFPKHKQQHNWNSYNGTTVLLIIYFLISRFKWDYLHPLTTWQLCTDVNRGLLGEVGILCGLATLTKHHILPLKDFPDVNLLYTPEFLKVQSMDHLCNTSKG